MGNIFAASSSAAQPAGLLSGFFYYEVKAALGSLNLAAFSADLVAAG